MRQIQLKGIDVRFPGCHALRGIELDLAEGQVLLMAGPNGAGKSTLIRVLLGLVRPDAGLFTLDGHNLRIDNSFKQRLGYLPEAVAFADNLSGRQVLQFFASARGVARGRIGETLERVGLAHAAKRKVRTYSKGMRQRLGLAVAILHQPELLILDEPTGGLDQEGLALLNGILSEWRCAGRILLLTSHDLSLLEHRVDRLCLLERGQVCAYGSSSELRSSAALPVSVDFELAPDEGSRRAFANVLTQWAEAGPIQQQADCLTVEIAPNKLAELMDIKARNSDAISGVRVREPGLNDVYESFLRKVV